MTPDPRNAILLQRFQERLDVSSKRVYSPMDLNILIAQLHAEHPFPRSTSERKFQQLLIDTGILKEIALGATYPLEAKRYHRDSFSPYELALSIKPGSYLSHGTAAYFHTLTECEPKTIYVNKEQSLKNSKGTLTQAGIERAFSNKQRHSGFIITHNHTTITLLSGKHSDRLGVIKMTGNHGEQLELTDIERTLIDIAVRPAYAGGSKAVAETYRRALQKTSVTRLTKMLADLRYVYPYHQAIGFYLQNAGHALPSLQALRQLGSNFDFYLEHGAKSSWFDPYWRIHCPDDLPQPSFIATIATR
jgi:predicted transcriptional regulator of viral defense system